MSTPDEHPSEGPRHVFRATLVQRLVGPILLVVSAMVMLSTFAGSEETREDGSITSFVGGIVVGAVVLLVISARAGADVEDDALVIRNAVTSARVPWESIDDLTVDSILGSRGVTVRAAGRVTRLRAPRSGALLWTDPAFDTKARVLREAWLAGGGTDPRAAAESRAPSGTGDRPARGADGRPAPTRRTSTGPSNRRPANRRKKRKR